MLRGKNGSQSHSGNADVSATILGLRLEETMSPHQTPKKGIMSGSWATCSVTPQKQHTEYIQDLTSNKGNTSPPRIPYQLAEMRQRGISKP